MTTIPSRIDRIMPVIEAVLGQSVPVSGIELNIPKTLQRTGEPYVLPGWFANVDRLQVFRTEDYGSITKVAPTLERYLHDSETFIWSVDDDVALPSNQLEVLLRGFRTGHRRILTRYGGALNNGVDFQNWFGESPVTFLEGFGSVLYPPGCVLPDFMDYVRATSRSEDCKRSDDVVLSMYFNQVGVEIYLYNKPSDQIPYMVEGWLDHAKIDPLSEGGHRERYGRVVDFVRTLPEFYSAKPVVNSLPAKRNPLFYVGDNVAVAAALITRLKLKIDLPPFYIATPEYSAFTGGPIALHVLCHFLNKIGCDAYISTSAFGDGRSIHAHLLTPRLAPEIELAHKKAHRDPIALYPEILYSTPNHLACRRVARLLLNVPGARWGGEAAVSFWRQSDRRLEFILHFAEEFAVDYLASSSLFIPIVDDRIFYLPERKLERHGFLIYSSRRTIATEEIPDWAFPYTRIDMSEPRTPEQLGDLYRRSKALLVSERTGAQLEALMCGCPTVVLPNDGLTEIPMSQRFGALGVGLGAEIRHFEWAASTAHNFNLVYEACANSFPIELALRVEEMMSYFKVL